MKIPRRLFFGWLLILIISGFAQATTWEVDCDQGEKMKGVLQRAVPGDTVMIRGTCHETVIIRTDRITIEGQDQTIIVGEKQSPGIVIAGVQGVVVKQVVVQNGRRGIIGKQGASFVLQKVTVQNNSDEGIRVDEGSSARLIDCTVRRNGEEGIKVLRHSRAAFSGNTRIEENRNVGVSIQGWSMASFEDSVQVLHNAGNGVAGGILVSQASAVHIANTGRVTIQGNRGTGVLVAETSVIQYGSDQKRITNSGIPVGKLAIEHNTSDGICVLQSSQVTLKGRVHIRNNQGKGVFIVEHSRGIFDPGIAIHDNADDGFMVSRNSRIRATNIVVQDNGNHGMVINESEAEIGHSVIRGNRTGDVLLGFNARASLYQNTVERFSCHGTSLVQGDMRCP